MRKNRQQFLAKTISPEKQREYIKDVLRDEGQSMLNEHRSRISQLLNSSGKLESAVQIDVKSSGEAGGVLGIDHLKYQRFLDMKTRTDKKGVVRRKLPYPIHNKVVFGFLNNMIRRLAFCYRESIRNTLNQLANE